MSSSKESILVVRFDAEGQEQSSRRVLRALGLNGAKDSRCRWFEQGLLSVRLRRPVKKSVVGQLKSLPGVRGAASLDSDFGLISRRSKKCRTVVLPHGKRIGGGLSVIAGPCSVESKAQICTIARMVRDAGAMALRGGGFKPRTSPYSFGGLGECGLEYLAEAREKTGLPVVTEILDTADIDLVSRYADVFQIGSRNMQNFPLLFKVGSHASGKPILLKRGFGCTIEELLLAAEYILLGRVMAGIRESGLILCERGIRTFEPSTRFTLDVGAFPVLNEKTDLPVIADPSHPAGNRSYVPALARAAVAAGADGLLVEVHADPKRAWSDAEQCMDPRAFRKMMVGLRRLASLR